MAILFNWNSSLEKVIIIMESVFLAAHRTRTSALRRQDILVHQRPTLAGVAVLRGNYQLGWRQEPV